MHFEDAMSPVDAKRRHFASYEVANSRERKGRRGGGQAS